MGKRIIQVLFAVISLFAMVNMAQAEEVELDKFRFAIGGYTIARYDSHISLTDANLGAGLTSNSLEIEEDGPNYQLKFDNTINGALL